MSQLLALYMGSLILRSIGIAAIAGICAWKVRNVAIRHAVWVAVLGAMLLMPVVDYLLPPAWIPARIQQIASVPQVNVRIVSARSAGVPQILTPAAAVPARSKSVDWWRLAAALYALVAFAMFIRLGLGYRKMRHLRRTGRAIASSAWEAIVAPHRTRWRIPVLLESEAVQVPMTIGLVRPAVILPVDWKAWDDFKMKAVLLHEVAHIRRGDWAIAVMAAAVKCAYWLNPLSWFLERKLSHLAEQASDDASLSGMQSTARYAEILLEFAAATQNGGRLMKGGVAMAQHNMTARIERVLGKTQPGTGFVRIVGWMLVMILAAPVIYAAAALQVASEHEPVTVPAYTAVFGQPPVFQARKVEQQPSRQVPPAAVSQTGPGSSNQAAELQDLSQLKLQDLLIQREIEQVSQRLRRAQLQQELLAQAPAPQNPTADVLQGELYKLQDQLVNVKAEMIKIQAQSKANTSPIDTNEIDRLREQLESLKVEQSLRVRDSGNRIFVTGKVQKPGAFESDEPLTVLQALASAGGFQEYAKPDSISIIRMEGGSTTLLRFDYSELMRGTNLSQNIYLRSGDVVVVP